MKLKRLIKISIGYIVIYSAFEVISHLTGDNIIFVNAVLICVSIILISVIVEKLFFKQTFPEIFVKLGLGTPKAGAIVASIMISIVLLLFYPIISSISGYQFILPINWFWLELGVLLTHGIAEEVMYRGFLFRHLREEVKTFWHAAFLSVPFFAAAHIPIIATQGFIIGGTALLLAIVSSFPLAYLFERGGNTIWAPALVHSIIDTIIPILAAGQFDKDAQSASIIWMIASMLIPYLAFMFLRKSKR